MIALSFLSFLDSSWQLGIAKGWELTYSTLLATLFLECLSWSTVRNVDPSLYRAGWLANVRNHVLLGIPVYAVSVKLFCIDRETEAWHVLGLTFVHAWCYYSVHRLLHTPKFYRYHKFHHRYHIYIPPSAANAVTVVEYFFAYVIPFGFAAAVLRPTERELRLSVYAISGMNLWIHTPLFKHIQFPSWLVSTKGHAEHHRHLNQNYAAPIWNLDWMLTQSLTILKPQKKVT